MITNDMVITWVVTIGIGAVVIGLIKYIFSKEMKRLDSVEDWAKSRPPLGDILTKLEHVDICKCNMGEIKEVVLKQYASLREYFETRMMKEILQAQMQILQELRHINGGKK